MSIITRQIEELRTYAKDRKGELAKMINDAANTIELLSAEPESKPWKWEPVSEKLPELDEDGYSEKLLLSFCNFPLPTIGEYRVSDGVGKWYDGDSDESVNAYALKVNAWMPLPKPYRGEDK